MSKETYTLLGRFSKSHGLKGEIILKREELAINYPIPEFLFIEINGLHVPYYVDSHSERNSGIDIIKLEDLTSIDDANLLLGAKVYIPTIPELQNNQTELSPLNLVSFEVVDEKEGLVGKVSSIIETKGQSILQIENNQKEILIPYTKQIITNVNSEDKIIEINAPEGLIGLYL
ncbi:MAG: 16S rRNA processing protein RimM [Bacteroidetes bacterium]|nr:16S rRNA processing protein RimM [Bacteroidota bacterium]